LCGSLCSSPPGYGNSKAVSCDMGEINM